MPPAYMWQALEGQGWPATHEQERMFVEDLRRTSEPAESSIRADATCCLNALRCGVGFADLRQALPGIVPAAVLHAYLNLRTELIAALAAWSAITADPTPETLGVHGASARRLLPVPVHRVTTIITLAGTRVAAARAVAVLCIRIERVTGDAHAVERLLGQLTPGDPLGIRMGAELHNVADPALWSNEYFLPRRVGELSPARVADLRGDPR